MPGAGQLAKALAALALPGALTEAAEALVDVVAGNLDDADQATLKEALADLQADNDRGHARLQEKFRVAAAR